MSSGCCFQVVIRIPASAVNTLKESSSQLKALSIDERNKHSFNWEVARDSIVRQPTMKVVENKLAEIEPQNEFDEDFDGHRKNRRKSVKERGNHLLHIVKMMRTNKTTNDDRSQGEYLAVSMIDVSPTTISISSLKAVIQGITSYVLPYELVLIDPVHNECHKVISTPYLKHLLNKEVESQHIHFRKVLIKILDDFQVGLESPDSETKICALFGLRSIALCKENLSKVHWYNHISDAILLHIIENIAFDVNEIQQSLCLHSLTALWGVTANSYILRRRIGILRGTEAVCAVIESVSECKRKDETCIGILMAAASLLTVLSQEETAQEQLWDHFSCLPVLQSLLDPVKHFPDLEISKINEIQKVAFKIISNSCVALRNASSQNDGPMIHQLILHMLIAVRNQESETKNRIGLMRCFVTIMACIGPRLEDSFQYVEGMQCLECLETILESISTVLKFKIKDKMHFFQNAILVISYFATMSVNFKDAVLVRQSSCAFLLDFTSSNRKQLVIVSAAIETLIDSFSGPYSKGGDSLVDLLSSRMIQLLIEGNCKLVHSIAFNIARIKFIDSEYHAMLFEYLLQADVLNLLVEKLNLFWDVPVTQLQLMSALGTLTAFQKFRGVPRLHQPRLLEVAQRFFNQRDCMESSTKLSNCILLLWNLASGQLIEDAIIEFLLKAAEQHVSSPKPIWEISVGSIFKSLMDLPAPRADPKIVGKIVDFFCSQLLVFGETLFKESSGEEPFIEEKKEIDDTMEKCLAIPPLPCNASSMLKKTDQLFKAFHSLKPPDVAFESRIGPLVAPQTPPKAKPQINFQLLNRCDVLCSLFCGYIRKVPLSTPVLFSIKDKCFSILAFLVSLNEASTAMRESALELSWKLASTINEDAFATQPEEYWLFAQMLHDCLKRAQQESAQHNARTAKLCILLFNHVQSMLHAKHFSNGIKDTGIHSVLIGTLTKLHHNDSTPGLNLAKCQLLSALIILCKAQFAFQQLIFGKSEAMELVLVLAHDESDIPLALLARQLVILLKRNPKNSTLFYKCDLRDNELRSKLHVWMEVEADITIGMHQILPEALLDVKPFHKANGIRLSISTHINTPDISYSSLFREPGHLEADILPAPRCLTLMQRLAEKPAMIRGPLLAHGVEDLVNRSRIGIEPHKFLHNGSIQQVPLEFKLLEPAALKLSQEEDPSLDTEENDWSIENSIFAQRNDPEFSGSQYFCNTNASVEEVFEFDWAMCLRKPYFNSNIVSSVPNTDLDTCKKLLRDEYMSFLKVFMFYCGTEDLKGVNNVFTVSKNQYWQLLEDNSLPALAPHVSRADFELIFQTMITRHAVPTDAELKANMECAILKHQKTVSYLVRYQFLECFFHLAKCMFLNAPTGSKMGFLSRAVALLIERCVTTVVGPSSAETESFRHNNLYRKHTHQVFLDHHKAIRNQVFNSLAGSSIKSPHWGGSDALRMSILDWQNLIDALGVLNHPHFSCADSNMIFLSSIVHVPDLVKEWKKACTLIFPSFLEAILRLCHFIPLPNENTRSRFGIDSISMYYDFQNSVNAWNLFEGCIHPSQGFIPATKVHTLLDLVEQYQVLMREEQLRKASWFDRLSKDIEWDAEFDVQVARDLHLNYKLLRGLTKSKYKPDIKVINNEEIDIANTEFENLPASAREDYLLKAYIACRQVRKEMHHIEWIHRYQEAKLTPEPRVLIESLPKTDGGEEDRVCMVRIEFEKYHHHLIGDADANLITKIVSQRFEIDCCKELYASWLLRHPYSVQHDNTVDFYGLDYIEKQEFVEISQVAVMRYIQLIRVFWETRRKHSSE